MKKLYIEPTSALLMVNTGALLTASDPEVGYDRDQDPIEPGKVNSRRKTVWDEDDEEDEENY